MVMWTMSERFLEGRRLGFGELHELLVESPELRDAVWEQLSKRHFTRRGLREGIERLPELRVELGRRLLERDARVVDLLLVMVEVPELRGLALEVLRDGGFGAGQVMRAARRNPGLRGVAVEAVLARDRSVGVVEEQVERVPGSGPLIVEALERLGVPAAEVSALVSGVSGLEAGDVATASSTMGGTAGSATAAPSGGGMAREGRSARGGSVEGRTSGAPERAGRRGGRERWFEGAAVGRGGSGAEETGVAGETEGSEVGEGAGSVARALEVAADVVSSGSVLDPMTWVRAAQRDPELVGAAVDAVLGEGVTRERVVALSTWLPGSEAVVAGRLARMGLPDAVLEELAAALPDLIEALQVQRN